MLLALSILLSEELSAYISKDTKIITFSSKQTSVMQFFVKVGQIIITTLLFNRIALVSNICVILHEKLDHSLAALK